MCCAVRSSDASPVTRSPTRRFIKLGQALSIRTDLIPEAYALELRQLQDAVPAFDSREAFDILRKELMVSDLSKVFKKISPKPVASASIGQVHKATLTCATPPTSSLPHLSLSPVSLTRQVYKATLIDGREVAVKVQRPKVRPYLGLY